MSDLNCKMNGGWSKVSINPKDIQGEGPTANYPPFTKPQSMGPDTIPNKCFEQVDGTPAKIDTSLRTALEIKVNR
jgi:hypothetical protein